MATLPFVVPFPLVNRLDPADFARGAYNAGLTGDDRYAIGDLVTLRSGAVVRSTETTTAANVEKLAIAGQPWSMPKAFTYFLARGVPLNRIDRRDEWVFTFTGAYDATLQGLVASRATLDVLFDATEKTLTVRNATASPTVKILRLFKGAPADVNVQVVVNFLENKLL